MTPSSTLHRLILISIILLIVGAASFAVAAPPGQEATPEATAHPPTGEEGCADCHEEIEMDWATGAHAVAYTKASFQAAWEAAKADPACLQCHTTNYEPPTGKYLAENVQCEACHGMTPADHPPETLVTRTDAGVCRDCHTATFAEFRQSMHAFPEEREALGCANCHDPHTQKLRVMTVDELCLGCHESAPKNYVHVKHRSMETGLFSLDCASCHMYNSQRDQVHELVDHKMLVDTVPCSNCHQEMAKTGEFSVLENVTAAEERNELRTQVEELEVRLAAVPPAQAGVVELAQGGLIGLLLGVIGVAFVWRGGRRNGK